MKVRFGFACLAAAVSAVSITSAARAQVLQWDADPATPGVQDGDGTWDTTSPTWTPYLGTTNQAWVNGQTAFLGDPATPGAAGTPFGIDLAANIVVNDLRFGSATNGRIYNVFDSNGGSLTVNGNIVKASTQGQAFMQLNSGLTLSAGTHTFTMNDTPGAVNEMVVDAAISGNANVVVNNGTYESWGSVNFARANTYTGTTTITKGALVISDSNALGTTGAGTLIEDAGTLLFGGNGAVLSGPLTINEPITVTRSVYSGGAYGNYAAAITSDNNNNTISGPLALNTTDGRIRVEGGVDAVLTITSNITSTTGAKLSNSGAGILRLTGNNSQLTGGMQIIGGTLSVGSQDNLGGANSILIFGSNTTDGTTGAINGSGGGYLRIENSFMTDFGTHQVNYNNFSGGIDLPDAAQVFNITQNLTGNQIVKRGNGTLNLTGTNVMSGASYIDLGVMHVTGTQTVGQQFARNGTLLLDGNANYTINKQYSSFGIVPGENGTLTMKDNAVLTAGDYDFNISDLGSPTVGGGSKGTFSLSGNAVANIAGTLYAAKNDNTSATINISDSASLTVGTTGARRGFILGRGPGATENLSPMGTFNMTGGSVYVTGEFQVGDGKVGKAAFNMSGGTVTVDSWMQFGRVGADSVADISGGTITKTGAGGGNMYVGEQATSTASINLHGTGKIIVESNEFWIGNDGGTGSVTISDTASLAVNNNWFAVGRNNGGVGTLTINGGTVTKAGNGAFIVGSGRSTGTVTQVAGSVTANTTYIAEGGTGTGTAATGLYDISGGTANLGALEIGRASNVANTTATSGELRISGTGAVTAGAVLMGGTQNATQAANGTINVNGGSLSVASIAHGVGTGTATVNFNAGKLSVGSYQLAGGLKNTGTGQLSPGLDNNVAANASTTGYTQGATASAKIELASASSFDSLAVTGGATLGGTLNLALLNGYVPTKLVAHPIVTADTITGTFATITGVSISPTQSLAVTYTPTGVNVTQTRPGDADVNGTVAFADLLSLAKNYNKQAGGTWSVGDFDGDGKVVFADLLILAKNYNQAAQADLSGFSASFESDFALAQSLVPEPASLSLLGLGAAAAFRRTRRSK